MYQHAVLTPYAMCWFVLSCFVCVVLPLSIYLAVFTEVLLALLAARAAAAVMYPLCVVQLFCSYIMAAEQPYKPRKPCWDSTLSGDDAPDLAARFLEWYILKGHVGLNVSQSVAFRGHVLRQLQNSSA
jgi:hypothetical protein